MAEQRQVRRHPAAILRVSFEHPASGERAAVPAWDASLGGMFLETDTPLDEGALIALEIGTAETTVSVDARVLWTRATKLDEDQPAGMAVRFIDLPDDVSVALNRALQSGMQERTILGVGGASKEPTQIGIPAAVVPSGRVPRETQIGVAPPANIPAATSSPAPVPEAPAPKPRLELSDTSLPLTPAAPRAAAPDTSRTEDTVPSRARASLLSDLPALPVHKTGIAGRLFLLLLLGGAAGAVYVYREPLAQMIAPPAPTSSPAPVESARPSPAEDAAAATSDASDYALALDAAPLDGAAHDASATEKDAGPHDAGARDASRDGGLRDAGRADSGAHAAGKGDAGRAPSKHP